MSENFYVVITGPQDLWKLDVLAAAAAGGKKSYEPDPKPVKKPKKKGR